MTMVKLNKCRICLADNVRMNVVTNMNLQEIYEKLTDVPFVTEDRRPMLACFLCYSKLSQCYQLQRKCVEAEKMLAQMLNEDYETKPLIKQGQLEFGSESHKSIFHGCQIERLALNEELPAVCEELPDITEPKKECQNDELELENFDNRYLNVADVPPHHSESDLEDDIPLMEIKIEVEEEHEVSKNNQRARETTSTITRGEDGVCERLDVFIEPKEEPQTDELEPENNDSSFLDVADISQHHSESDLDDDIPLTEFKTEVDEEQEVPTRVNVAKKPELEDAMTAEQTKEEKSGSKVIRTIKKQIGETRYKCDVCQRSFSKTSALIKHKRIHTGEKPFKCDLCERSFIEKSALTNHSRVHTGEKPFKCHICQCSFRQTGALKIHIRQHLGEKAFKCHLCQRSFSQKSVLANHIRIHTGEKPFKCNICQCSFRQSSHLTTHIRQHTGEKPYKCDICLRSFTQKWDLTKHNRIHTGEKPYKCDSCERSFTQKSALTKHIRIHTGEKPYKCDVCQRSFRDKRALTKHNDIC